MDRISFTVKSSVFAFRIKWDHICKKAKSVWHTVVKETNSYECVSFASLKSLKMEEDSFLGRQVSKGLWTRGDAGKAAAQVG